MAIKLSILDQSPISEESTAIESLKYTAELAKEAEEFGYTRFWLSEHHDATTLEKACSICLRNLLTEKAG